MTTLSGHFGSITFDGQTITFAKKMRGTSAIPISKVSTVMVVPAGIGMRGIVVVASGANGPDIPAIGNHAQIANLPFGLTFKKKLEPQFQELANQIIAATA